MRQTAKAGNVSLVTLYLDAGVPTDCVGYNSGHLSVATLLLDRGSAAIDAKNSVGNTPLLASCHNKHLSIATLLLDRGSNAIDEKGSARSRPLVPALFTYGMACSSSERTGSQTVSKTPEQREQVRAAQVAHAAASTSAHDPLRPRPCVWPCELVWRRAGRPRPTRGRHTRRPGGRVVCTGIDNPGSNVFPASRPVWQWGGTRYNFYLALRLMRRALVARHLFFTRAGVSGGWTEAALRLSVTVRQLSQQRSLGVSVGQDGQTEVPCHVFEGVVCGGGGGASVATSRGGCLCTSLFFLPPPPPGTERTPETSHA